MKKVLVNDNFELDPTGKQEVIINEEVKAALGQYTWYKDKVWHVVSTDGSGKTLRKILQREMNREKLSIAGDNLESVLLVVSPKGYKRI